MAAAPKATAYSSWRDAPRGISKAPWNLSVELRHPAWSLIPQTERNRAREARSDAGLSSSTRAGYGDERRFLAWVAAGLGSLARATISGRPPNLKAATPACCRVPGDGMTVSRSRITEPRRELSSRSLAERADGNADAARRAGGMPSGGRRISSGPRESSKLAGSIRH